MFIACATQWRVGMSGPTGLDYSAVQSVFRIMGVLRSDWPQVFDDLRIMEDAALEVMRKEKK